MSSKRFIVPDGVVRIEDGTCYFGNGEKSVEIPKDILGVVIPNSVTKIGAFAFRDCTSLTLVEIPNSVETIGGEAFDVHKLLSIQSPDSILRIGDILEKYPELTFPIIPDSVMGTGRRTFEGCASFTSVRIPNSVMRIGEYAFAGCTSLTSVEFPDSVTEIGRWAFHGCASLEKIYVPEHLDLSGTGIPDSAEIIRR